MDSVCLLWQMSEQLDHEGTIGAAEALERCQLELQEGSSRSRAFGEKGLVQGGQAWGVAAERADR